MDRSDWLPIRFYWQGNRAWLDWCQPGDLSLSEPFFDHSIEKCFQNPFNLLFRKQTPIESVVDLENRVLGVEPTGFIFHMSRCGSTLASQMLATLPNCTIVSEPGIIDTLFRSVSYRDQVSNKQLIAWLRGIILALSRVPRPAAEPFFLKFSSWNTLYLPLIRQAFPEVPWVFLYRDPVEVLVSLHRMDGGALMPGVINPADLGMCINEALHLTKAEYHARTLAAICKTAIDCEEPGLSQFVNYSELPAVIWELLPESWGFPCHEAERKKMRERARFGGKNPTSRFVSDTDEKHKAAPAELRNAAEKWLSPVFQKMEFLRVKRK